MGLAGGIFLNHCINKNILSCELNIVFNGEVAQDLFALITSSHVSDLWSCV